MTYTFRPAIREDVSLLIGISGPSGSGKTFSAMRMASGIANGESFAVIDTERGRARHYADQFKFDVCDLEAPFRPETYSDAIMTADKAGYSVIVVDSVSHVWSGDGGVLDWVEDELERMAGSDWRKRESCKMAAYIKPKMAHKQMVQKLLQVKAHLILCFRAAPKVEMVKDQQTGKMIIQEKKTLTSIEGYIPECEKNLPFELTASFLMTPDHPGYPKPIKLQEQHKALFPLDRPINEQSGKLVAAWAAGALNAAPSANVIKLRNAINEAGFVESEVLAAWKKNDLNDVQDVEKALEWIGKAKAKQTQPAPSSQAAAPLTLDSFIRLINSTSDLDVLKAHGKLIEQLPEACMDDANEELSFRFDELRNT